MDLGGSGLVVTLARGIMADGYPLAVLCIDLPVHARKSLPDLIRDHIRNLGGYTMTVTATWRHSRTADPPATLTTRNGLTAIPSYCTWRLH